VTQPNTHESFSRSDDVAIGSERSFGLVMAVARGVIALINWWHAGRVWPWLGGIAVLFLAAALIYARILRPLNTVWFKFGLLLHHIVNPIMMGLLFYLTIWPTGLILRITGKEFLRLKREPERDSYWIVRDPPGPQPESMRDQF
jgi:hypothetical protein